MRVWTDGATVSAAVHAITATKRDTNEELLRLVMTPHSARLRPILDRLIPYCHADRGTPPAQPWACQKSTGVHVAARASDVAEVEAHAGAPAEEADRAAPDRHGRKVATDGREGDQVGGSRVQQAHPRADVGAQR